VGDAKILREGSLMRDLGSMSCAFLIASLLCN
jgi:hypothetical protein